MALNPSSPHSLVDVLEALRDVLDALDGASVVEHLVLQVRGPQAQVGEVRQQVLVHHHKLATRRGVRGGDGRNDGRIRGPVGGKQVTENSSTCVRVTTMMLRRPGE